MLNGIFYISIHIDLIYWSHALVFLSSQFSCFCYVAVSTVSISAPAIEMILLFSCLLQPCHLSRATHANTFVCLVPHHLFCVASPLWYMPLVHVGVHLLLLLLAYYIDVHIGRSTAVSIMLTFMLRPHISSSLFSSWLWHDNQSAINNSGPGLNSIHTPYWCMHRVIHCRCWDNVATFYPLQLPMVYGMW